MSSAARRVPVLAQTDKRMSIKAVILLGGPSRGTRFRPLSFNTPKPLFPVAGEPIIYHHLKACAKIPGLKEVLLIGFYDPALFTSFMQQAEAKLGLSVRYLREFKALGTGGGLYHFRDQLLLGKPEQLIVLHADVYGDFHLPDLLDVHLAHGNKARCTILGKVVSANIARSFGCLVANAETKQVEHYAEKPETLVSDVINCGVYVFTTSLFERLAEVFERNHAYPLVSSEEPPKKETEN